VESRKRQLGARMTIGLFDLCRRHQLKKRMQRKISNLREGMNGHPRKRIVKKTGKSLEMSLKKRPIRTMGGVMIGAILGS